MKTYIISSDKAKGADLYGIASASGSDAALCPKFYDDYRQIIDEVAAKRGIFDFIFVITGSPIGLSTELNRMEWVRAAVCGSADEAAEARDVLSNVIIMNANSIDEKVMSAIVANSLNLKVHRKRGLQERLEAKAGDRQAARQKKDAERKVREAEIDYSDFDSSGKKRPFKDRLKRSLGLGDAQ